MKEMWDERFGGREYFYGTKPNAWFREQINLLEAGRILFPAEGEGRNAVYAAALGWQADAFDYSQSGQRKALALARRNGVEINYRVADALDVSIPEGVYDAVALIYAHFPPHVRRALFPRLTASLKPGGIILAEVFSVNQLGLNSGGPKSKELLYTPQRMKQAFDTLTMEYLQEETIMLNEGPRHAGTARVIRMKARREA